MFNWVYDKTMNQWLYGGPYDPAFDKDVQGLCVLAKHPDRRLERYDGKGGSRAATAQEIAECDDAQKSAQADALDTSLAIQALGKVLLDRIDAAITVLNQCRTEATHTQRTAIPSVDRAKFWTDVKAHYKSLLL